MAEQKGRRQFLLKSALAVAGFPILGRYLTACSPSRPKPIAGKLQGPSFKAGHLLRKGISVIPEEIEAVDVVIVGGGVSGLSANRWLHQNSSAKVVLLELEDQPGGNAVAGRNKYTAYPWGAHYLTLPNNDLPELLQFLEEEAVITGYNEQKLPVYNEYYLCFDPEERLFINGYWQQGLVPNWGVPEAELKETARFFKLIEEYRQAKGADGKFAFAIPLAASSADETYRQLDKLSMKEWLHQEKFSSPHLLWYLNYCCLDDYGSRLEDTSAWAGIHYFASRRAKAANTDSDRVLTWPEGNFWLVNRLRQAAENNIRTNALTYRVHLAQDKVLVDYLDVTTNKHRRLVAKQCILATSHFVNERLLQGMQEQRNPVKQSHFSYSTWLVANLTLKEVPSGRGTPLCWDNVIYGSCSLGYVYANQQQVQLYPAKKTITFYYPLTGEHEAQVRAEAYRKEKEAWQEMVLTELEKAHPAIRKEVETLDVWVWGHGMIRPTVGFIWGEEKRKAEAPVQDKVFFAHTDLSGISVFEEAFYQGLKAAKQIINTSHEA
ncbi:NAD(P)-binding protein [Botryobacter ruber]|uniref:NAD(P)-binding protein n=1 Tax=Botryobacter ruber TaxID=2171629 RepID=UPI000E0BBC4B|nr:NAD(P)-binding protein [Botryobacter ruber]